MAATLTLTRATIGVEVRRAKYEVLLDGGSVGSYDVRETFEMEIEPGRHRLQVRGGRYSSRELSFEVSEGQTVSFNCSGKRWLPIWLASFAIPSLGLNLRRVRTRSSFTD